MSETPLAYTVCLVLHEGRKQIYIFPWDGFPENLYLFLRLKVPLIQKEARIWLLHHKGGRNGQKWQADRLIKAVRIRILDGTVEARGSKIGRWSVWRTKYSTHLPAVPTLITQHKSCHGLISTPCLHLKGKAMYYQEVHNKYLSTTPFLLFS